MISIIAAIARNGVIGKDSKLPWYLPGDLRRFKALTTGFPVIMGRKTFESLGGPLKDRRNIVIASKIPHTCACHYYFRVTNLQEALGLSQRLSPKPQEVFVIGGAVLFKEALLIADKMYLTLIDQDFEGDVFFPQYDKNDWVETDRSTAIEENGYKYEWVTLVRKN